MLRQIGVGGDSLSRTIHNNVEPIDLIFDRGMFFIMILKVHMFIPTLGLRFPLHDYRGKKNPQFRYYCDINVKLVGGKKTMNYSQNISVGRWRVSATITLQK